MSGRHRGWVRAAIAIATIALIGVFARTVDWSRAWDAMSNADPLFICLAVTVNLATLVIKAIRWRLFLAPIGVPSVGLAIRSTLAGAALNNVLVAHGGDAARVAAVARLANVSSADVLATAAVDKFCDLATYVVIFVVAAFALPLPPELARWRMPGLASIAAVAAVAAVIIWRSQPSSSGTGAPEVTTFATRTRAYIRRLVKTLAQVSTARRLTIALSIALTAWAGQWATFHFAAVAASFPATPATSLLALLTVNASFLVRLTPGNVGVFQLLYALAATSAGLDRDGAVAVAFLISLIQYIPVTSTGLVLAASLARRDVRVPVGASLERNDIVTTRPGGGPHGRT